MGQPDFTSRGTVHTIPPLARHRTGHLSARSLLGAGCCALMLVAAPAAAQNLLANPDFNLGADGWIDCDDESTPDWLATDEAGCQGSGSALASACAEAQYGISLGQCVELPPTSDVFVAARLRATSGLVVIALYFCTQSACVGDCSTDLVATDDGDGQWKSVSGHKVVPPGTQSAVFVAGATASGMTVNVDTTYLGLAPPQFRDDFEADAAATNTPCRWSAVAP